MVQCVLCWSGIECVSWCGVCCAGQALSVSHGAVCAVLVRH